MSWLEFLVVSAKLRLIRKFFLLILIFLSAFHINGLNFFSQHWKTFSFCSSCSKFEKNKVVSNFSSRMPLNRFSELLKFSTYFAIVWWLHEAIATL